MIIESKKSSISNDETATYLVQIITEFTDAISTNNCEISVPLSMWLELENSKNSLEFYNNLFPDTTVIDNGNNPEVYTFVDEYYDTDDLIGAYDKANNRGRGYGSDGCFDCKPIEISYTVNPFKIDLKKNITDTLYLSSYISRGVSLDMCSAIPILANGCLSDNLKLLSLLLTSLSLLTDVSNIQSQALSFYISGTISASISLSIRDAIMISSFSLKKGECLSEIINQLLSIFPTNTEVLEEDKKTIKANISKISTGFKSLADKITSAEKQTLDKVDKSLRAVVDIINSTVSRISNWVDGTFSMSMYSQCEFGKDSIKGSLKEISSLIALINTLISVIKIKRKKINCGDDSKLDTQDLINIIDDIVKIDDIIEKDKDTVDLIISDKKDLVVNLFGCKTVDEIIDVINTPIEEINNKTDEKIYDNRDPDDRYKNIRIENEFLKRKLSDSILDMISNGVIVNIVYPNSTSRFNDDDNSKSEISIPIIISDSEKVIDNDTQDVISNTSVKIESIKESVLDSYDSILSIVNNEFDIMRC